MDVMLVAWRKSTKAVGVWVSPPLLVRRPTYALRLVLRKFAICHREFCVAKMLYRRDDV